MPLWLVSSGASRERKLAADRRCGGRLRLVLEFQSASERSGCNAFGEIRCFGNVVLELFATRVSLIDLRGMICLIADVEMEFGKLLLFVLVIASGPRRSGALGWQIPAVCIAAGCHVPPTRLSIIESILF